MGHPGTVEGISAPLDNNCHYLLQGEASVKLQASKMLIFEELQSSSTNFTSTGGDSKSKSPTSEFAQTTH
jgi:hypothetical protein